MSLYEDLEGAEWVSSLDNGLLRAQLGQVGEQLLRITAERDVLEGVVTKALIAGAEAATTAAAEHDTHTSHRRPLRRPGAQRH